MTVTRTAPSFFAKLLGKNNATIRATARATVKTVTTLASNYDVMPWARDEERLPAGRRVPDLHRQRHNANNGAVSLPYVNGTNCPTPNGANPYRDEIAGIAQSLLDHRRPGDRPEDRVTTPAPPRRA